MRPLFLFYGRSAVQTGCNTKRKAVVRQNGKEIMDRDMDLWNALQKHVGHNVKITFEGEKDNPENILLQCEDCHFDILSADIETVCAREDC